MDSLVEHAGGLHFVAVFYAHVLADPLLHPLFGDVKPEHIGHLTAFTVECFGGIDAYTKTMGGFLGLIAAHRGLKIAEPQRLRFVELYMAAADEVGLPSDAAFREVLRSHVECGSEVAKQIALGLPALVAAIVLVLQGRELGVGGLIILSVALTLMSALVYAGLSITPRWHRIVAARLQPFGFAPYAGEFSNGIPAWPLSGFRTLDESPWAVSMAFDNACAGVRLFQGTMPGTQVSDSMSGAVFQVPGAEYPAFTIEPARHWKLFSTKPSAVTFRVDTAFANDFAVHTSDPQRLERALGATFMTLWRSTPGWRLEGTGNCVIVSQSEILLGPAQLEEFAALILALAGALRSDIDANRSDGRPPSMRSARLA